MTGSQEYANLHAQLMSWAECEPLVAGYCAQAGLPDTAAGCVTAWKTQLTELAGRVDAGERCYPVVIDTPPGEMSITRSAILAVPLVLVPLSPTGLDIDRLRPTWEALADLEPTHPLGLAVGVLLTRSAAVPGPAGRPAGVLTELDYPVMDTEIPLAEWPYAVSFGTSPSEFGAYDDLLAELKS